MPLLHFAQFRYTDWKGKRQQKLTLFLAPGFRELEIFTRLKKGNEEAAKKNAAFEQKVQDYYKTREELRTTKNELGSLKAMYKKVLDFIESLKLTQKLEEFLKQRARGVKR